MLVKRSWNIRYYKKKQEKSINISFDSLYFETWWTIKIFSKNMFCHNVRPIDSESTSITSRLKIVDRIKETVSLSLSLSLVLYKPLFRSQVNTKREGREQKPAGCLSSFLIKLGGCTKESGRLLRPSPSPLPYFRVRN